jgi:uncharacterized protein
MQELIDRVARAAKLEMAKQDPAHDWAHIERVRHWALRIADDESKRQPVNKLVVELAALTHDVGDFKAHGSHAVGQHAVQKLLSECETPQGILMPVLFIAMNVSFKGHGVPDTAPTIEHKIVQDGDRLDAIGAIAVARTFIWGAGKGRTLHDPNEPLLMADTADEYYALGGRTSINHFHEKLLHLKDRLHTDLAKTEGKRRHELMQLYVHEFLREWNCE